MKRRLLFLATVLVLPLILFLLLFPGGTDSGDTRLAKGADEADDALAARELMDARMPENRSLDDAAFVERELPEEVKELVDQGLNIVPSRSLEPRNASGRHLDNIPAGVSQVEEVLFENVVTEGEGALRRARVLKTDFHYPLLQTLEILKVDPETGEEKVAGYQSMVADHALVQLDLARAPENWESDFAAQGFEIRREITDDGLYTLGFEVEEADQVSRVIAALENDVDWVEYAEPDLIIAARTHEDPIPNDPFFDFLWGLQNTGQFGGTEGMDVRAVEAWKEQIDRQEARGEEPSPGRASWFDAQGEEHHVVVAVLDTGINLDHLDLVENLWINPREEENFRDESGSGFADDIHGASMVWDDGWPMDFHGHGSHVAGTIGAVGDNQKGVVGVAWDVRLMGVQILGAGGGGALSDAVRGIDYAWQQGAHILNNSWGFDHFGRSMLRLPTRTMGRAVERTRDADAIFVTAAGNDAHDVDLMQDYPSDFQEVSDNVVNVGAMNPAGNPSFFSSFGEQNVHVFAPGSAIVSTFLGFDQYAIMDGTSMAAPHIAGMFALLKAEFPDESYDVLIERLLQRSISDFHLAGFGVDGRRADLGGALDPSPLIYQPLQNRPFERGAPVRFSISVSGEGTRSYRWFRNGREIAGVNGPELDLGNVSYDDIGKYRVEVTTEFGTTSSEAELIEDPGSPAIGEALGAPELTWHTGDDRPWTAVEADGENERDGARSGAIDHNEATMLWTSVRGPGTLRFSWKVSSEDHFDHGRFIIDGEVKETISGEEGWYNRTYEIPSGTHDLVWHYEKDGSETAGADALWLNNVSYASDFPFIVSQTGDVELVAGAPAELSFEATGSNPVTFYWQKDGTTLAGEDSSTLTFDALEAGDAGIYVGGAVNVHGRAETRPITVEVVEETRAPTITGHPRSYLGFEGEVLQLYADWEGTHPATTQWYKDGAPLEGETEAALLIPALEETDSAEYTFRVENEAGEAETEPASVTVYPAQIQFDEWQELQDDLADSDRSGDTLSPLLRFALGADISGSDSRARPEFSLVSGGGIAVASVDGSRESDSEPVFAALEFDRPLNVAGVHYVLEASTDMRNWEEVEAFMEAIGEPDGILQRVRLRELDPVTGESRRFLRLRVETVEQ